MALALETRFSVEELAYLGRLPVVVVDGKSNMIGAGLSSWVRVQDVNGAAGCTNECEIFGHVRSMDDGTYVFYVRHGESLFRAGPCFENGTAVNLRDYKRAFDWIQSCHAHEAAVR